MADRHVLRGGAAEGCAKHVGGFNAELVEPAPIDASFCMLIGRAGVGERPMPGGSKAMTRNPVRYGSSGSHTPAWDQIGEYISRGSPSPQIWAWMRSPLIRRSRCAVCLADVIGVMGISP